MYKLIIVEDEPLARRGITTTIDWARYNIEIIGEASNGQEGFELVEKYRPDIILTDVKMPLIDGLEMIKKIRAAKIDAEFIILSGYGEFEFAKVALENSVTDYLLKPVSNEELIDTVLKVIEKIKAKQAIQKSTYILENSQDEIKRKVIRILVREHYKSREDLLNQLSMFGVNLINNGYFLVGVLDEEYEAGDTFEKLKVLETSILNACKNAKLPVLSGIYHEKACFMIECNDVAYLERILSQMLANYKHVSKDTVSVGISALFANENEIPRAYEEAKNVANNGLLKFINSVQLYNGTSVVYSPNLLRTLNVINQEYMDQIDVTYVSEKLNVSTSYLMHMIKDELDITFNKILVQTRIREAKLLLKTGEYRVNEVAYKVGFNDEKYFSMVFKKHENMTPSEYIKNHGQTI